MTENEAYLWDRLNRAVDRGPAMTLRQRHDLVSFIKGQTNDWELLAAAEKLVRYELTKAETQAGLAKWGRPLELDRIRRGFLPPGKPEELQKPLYSEEQEKPEKRPWWRRWLQ